MTFTVWSKHHRLRQKTFTVWSKYHRLRQKTFTVWSKYHRYGGFIASLYLFGVRYCIKWLKMQCILKKEIYIIYWTTPTPVHPAPSSDYTVARHWVTGKKRPSMKHSIECAEYYLTAVQVHISLESVLRDGLFLVVNTS